MREGRAVCLGLALLARAASAIPGRWNAARGLWRDPAVLSPGGLPFPHVSRMDATQRDAMARMKRIAEQQSEEATPRLLAVLGSQSFRALLTKCCNASALPGMSPRQLLDLIRSNVYASELVHNCDGSFDTDVTIEIGMNATEFFPSTWQLRFLEYYGPRFQPGFGFPTTPENSAEEGLPRSREHCARTRARASHGPAWTVELQPRRRGALSSAALGDAWARLVEAVGASLHVAVPRLGDCTDWNGCIGRVRSSGQCACYARPR